MLDLRNKICFFPKPSTDNTPDDLDILYEISNDNLECEKEIITKKSLPTLIEESDIVISYGKGIDFQRITKMNGVFKETKEIYLVIPLCGVMKQQNYKYSYSNYTTDELAIDAQGNIKPWKVDEETKEINSEYLAEDEQEIRAPENVDIPILEKAIVSIFAKDKAYYTTLKKSRMKNISFPIKSITKKKIENMPEKLKPKPESKKILPDSEFPIFYNFSGTIVEARVLSAWQTVFEGGKEITVKDFEEKHTFYRTSSITETVYIKQNLSTSKAVTENDIDLNNFFSRGDNNSLNKDKDENAIDHWYRNGDSEIDKIPEMEPRYRGILYRETKLTCPPKTTTFDLPEINQNGQSGYRAIVGEDRKSLSLVRTNKSLGNNVNNNTEELVLLKICYYE